MSAFLKKKELTEAQKEAMARPVPWQWILFTFGVLVPFLILIFGAEWFFPNNEWVQKYLGRTGKAIIISFIFLSCQILLWYSKMVSKKAEEEKSNVDRDPENPTR